MPHLITKVGKAIENVDKKLCYSRGTALCSMFHEVWEIERFQTASDLQGHSRVLAMVPFDRPHTISY